MVAEGPAPSNGDVPEVPAPLKEVGLGDSPPSSLAGMEVEGGGGRVGELGLLEFPLRHLLSLFCHLTPLVYVPVPVKLSQPHTWPYQI